MAFNSTYQTATLTAAVASNLDFPVDKFRRVWLVIKNTGSSNAIGTTAVSLSPNGTYFGTLAPIGTAVGSIAASGVSGVIEIPVRAKTLRVALTSTDGSTATVEMVGDERDGGDNALRVDGNVIGAVSAGALSVTTLAASGAITGGSTIAATTSVSAGTTVAATTAITAGTTITATGDINAGGGFRTLVGPWVQTNVAANQASVQIGLGATGVVHLDAAMPRAGSLVGITATFTVAPAGANIVIKVFKNGSLLDAAAILTVVPGATLSYATTFTKDTSGLTFAAADKLGIAVLTDGSWTATTSDLTVFAWVEC